VITAPPPPPAIEQPAPYQLSYGLVSGVAAVGTDRVIVRAGGRTLADLPLRQRHFQLRVALPSGDVSVQIVTIDGAGRRGRATVRHVFGAPRAAAPPARQPHVDQFLARSVRRLVDGFGGTSAVYVENLTTGAGAAWNARAPFPGASSLKLAIAVTALARIEGTPTVGTTLDALLRRMLFFSDNEAANQVEAYVGGSTYGGSSLVNSMMRSLGLVDTDMYGGYDPDAFGGVPRSLAGGIPLTVVSRPIFGRGKRTTAYDLASLLRAVWLASAGRGRLPVAQPGFTVADARYLLYLLAHVRDPGKLDRRIGPLPGVQVLHKAGWISSARHDNGIVLWRGGALLVTVMTYRSAGVGVASDVLAGDVAAAALRRYHG
jgi:hypothetical protein